MTDTKIWTEAEIIDHYAELRKEYGEYSDEYRSYELKLYYHQMPVSIQKQVDTIDEEKIFNFLSNAARELIDASSKALQGEEDKRLVSSIVRQAAKMRSSTFHDHFQDFVRVVKFVVHPITIIVTMKIGGQQEHESSTTHFEVNLTLIDGCKALQTVYHLPSESDKQEAEGVIATIPKNISLPIIEGYTGAFSSADQKGAHIVGTISPEENVDLSTMFDDSGKATDTGVRILESLDVAHSKKEKRSFVPFEGKEGQLSFIKSMYTIVQEQYRNNPEVIKGTISISRAALCNHLGIRYSYNRRINKEDPEEAEIAIPVPTVTEAEKFYDETDRRIMRAFNSCRNVVASLADGSWYYLLVFHGYDAKTDSYKVALPYPAAVVAAVDKKRIEKAKGRQKYNPNYGHNALINGTIYKCRNEPAKEILEYLLAKMIERGESNQTGEKGSKRIVYDVSCATIVENTYELSCKLQADIRKDRKNQTLLRAFGGVIYTGTNGIERTNLFRKYTDAYTYFNDLKIEWAIPNIQMLKETRITISWKPQKEKDPPPFQIIMPDKKKPKRKATK